MDSNQILGIDIGGTGIKAAIVDVDKGQMLTERYRVLTPKPAKPHAVAEVLLHMKDKFAWQGVVGVGFPAVIQHGISRTAANVDPEWVDFDVRRLFEASLGLPVHVINDADAAGLAEVHFGAAKGQQGVVLMITIGTGLGSALFVNGQLLPNSELGHLYLKGMDAVAEKFASNVVRENEDLSWEVWAERFNQYLAHIERLFTPDLILLGGGGGKRFDSYQAFLRSRCPILPAEFKNGAGVIGAAMAGRIGAEGLALPS